MQERREQMKRFIQLYGSVTMAQLEAEFSTVSGMTIRRDLEYLEQQGDIIRTRGGARSLAGLSALHQEVTYARRSQEHISEKLEIATKAAALVENCRSIYIDSGTTTSYLAQQLAEEQLLVVTNGLNIATELLNPAGCTVQLVGGELIHENFCLSGPAALAVVDTVNIELAFIAASGFSRNFGFTCGKQSECDLKRRVIERASKTVFLMDGSKAGKSYPFTFAQPQKGMTLVSDDNLPEEDRQFLIEKGMIII